MVVGSVGGVDGEVGTAGKMPNAPNNANGFRSTGITGSISVAGNADSGLAPTVFPEGPTEASTPGAGAEVPPGTSGPASTGNGPAPNESPNASHPPVSPTAGNDSAKGWPAGEAEAVDRAGITAGASSGQAPKASPDAAAEAGMVETMLASLDSPEDVCSKTLDPKSAKSAAVPSPVVP